MLGHHYLSGHNSKFLVWVFMLQILPFKRAFLVDFNLKIFYWLNTINLTLQITNPKTTLSETLFDYIYPIAFPDIYPIEFHYNFKTIIKVGITIPWKDLSSSAFPFVALYPQLAQAHKVTSFLMTRLNLLEISALDISLPNETNLLSLETQDDACRPSCKNGGFCYESNLLLH